jgi:DNA-directed RNA polymerase specialized sigma24 family protein
MRHYTRRVAGHHRPPRMSANPAPGKTHPRPHHHNARNCRRPLAEPEQRVIDADTARTLRKLVAELSPRRKTLLRALFTQDPRPYAEVARTAGIPLGAIGPTRARALQQLRDKLNEHELGSGA